MRRGDLFVISAPSGAGKSTIIRTMMRGGWVDADGIAFSVSHTTRAPRQGEVDGVDYQFVDPAEFQRMIEAEEFLEWAKVHNQHYGTSYGAVMPVVERGIDVILEIDVQGAEQVMARVPEAVGIFILPPSFEVLERRLRARGLDEADEISRRLDVSRWEIKRYKKYDYVIINDDLERASGILAAIILEKRHTLERQQGRIDQVLGTFEGVDCAED